MSDTGKKIRTLNLKGTTSIQEFINTIKKYAEKHPENKVDFVHSIYNKFMKFNGLHKLESTSSTKKLFQRIKWRVS